MSMACVLSAYTGLSFLSKSTVLAAFSCAFHNLNGVSGSYVFNFESIPPMYLSILDKEAGQKPTTAIERPVSRTLKSAYGALADLVIDMRDKSFFSIDQPS